MFTLDDVSIHKSVNGIRVLLTGIERQAIVDEWNANEIAAISQREIAELEKKRLAALAALQNRVLTSALSDPDAPQEVKDYAELLKTTRK